MALEISQRVHNSDHHIFGWFNYERRNWLAMALLAGGIGFAVGQGRTNQDFVAAKVAPIQAHDKAVTNKLKVVTTKVVPQLQAQVGCQTVRADVATLAATNAAVDPSVIPSCPPITK